MTGATSRLGRLGTPDSDQRPVGGRTERVDVIGKGWPGTVGSGGLRRTAVERRGEAFEGIVVTSVGELGALLILVLGVADRSVPVGSN